jgi:hypothetical protein
MVIVSAPPGLASNNGATDLHELRKPGAILIFGHQLAIGATIRTAHELTGLGTLVPQGSAAPMASSLGNLTASFSLKGNRLEYNTATVASVNRTITFQVVAVYK